MFGHREVRDLAVKRLCVCFVYSTKDSPCLKEQAVSACILKRDVVLSGCSRIILSASVFFTAQPCVAQLPFDCGYQPCKIILENMIVCPGLCRCVYTAVFADLPDTIMNGMSIFDSFIYARVKSAE